MIFHLFSLDLENENFESIPKIVSEQVELCFGKRKKKWLLVQPLPPLFSPQHQKTFSSTNPISQTLTIPSTAFANPSNPNHLAPFLSLLTLTHDATAALLLRPPCLYVTFIQFLVHSLSQTSSLSWFKLFDLLGSSHCHRI